MFDLLLFFSTYLFIESKGCLIDLPNFSYSPTRATRDIVVRVNELEEVKLGSMQVLYKYVWGVGVLRQKVYVKDLTFNSPENAF